MNSWEESLRRGLTGDGSGRVGSGGDGRDAGDLVAHKS